MLVYYFCGVDGRLKSLTRQTQVAGPTGSKRWPGRQKRSAGRHKALTRLVQNAPLHRASRQLFCTHCLVLQVPNMLWLVVDRDRLNLGVM